MTPRFHLHLSELRRLPGYEGLKSPRDFELLFPATVRFPRNNAVMFFKESAVPYLKTLSGVHECLFIVPETTSSALDSVGEANAVLPVRNPRLEFARLIQFALSGLEDGRPYRTLDNGVAIGQNVSLGRNVTLEPFVFVDHDVSIGDGCLIRAGARIRRFSEIGRGCEIRENAVVGAMGFGFERDADGIPVRLPHLGGVRIGSFVEVGALSTVAAGTIDPTVVEDHVKIDDHVHVGHNSMVRRGALLTACSEVGAEVEVGEFAWLGPNCSTLERVMVGARSTVGLGAVVIHTVEPGSTVAGSPARPTSELRALNQALSKLTQVVERP